MSVLLRRRTWFLTVFITYLGIVLIILPSMLWGKFHFPEVLNEIVTKLGEALLVAGIILLFLEMSYGRFEQMLGERQALFSKGIKSLKELNPKNTEQIIEYLPSSPQISLQFNVYEANRLTLELVNTLQRRKRQKARILATGLTREGLNLASGRTELPFETRMMTELLERRLTEVTDQRDVEIRISSETTFNTLILSERSVLVVVSLGAKKEESILLEVDFSSQLAEQYQQQFDELWNNAAT